MTLLDGALEMRWRSAVSISGESFCEFWTSRLEDKGRRVLYILGLGFDPRMTAAAEVIFPKVQGDALDCMLISIEVEEVLNDPVLGVMTQENFRRLGVLMGRSDPPGPIKIPMFSVNGKPSGQRKVTECLTEERVIGSTDVILDISSIPRLIYIPLIAKILHLLDSMGDRAKEISFHVVIADDAELDSRIKGVGTDISATAVFGFSTDIEADNQKNIPRIWIPIISESQEVHLRQIRTHLQTAAEICPVLPFPSRDPRRSDDIIISNPAVFTEFGVEYSNLIYASETNPFDVYAQLMKVSDSFHSSLKVLGGANVVFSPLSSKVQTVGATLAAYDLKRNGRLISIVLTMPTAYTYENKDNRPSSTTLHTLWLY